MVTAQVSTKEKVREFLMLHPEDRPKGSKTIDQVMEELGLESIGDLESVQAITMLTVLNQLHDGDPTKALVELIGNAFAAGYVFGKEEE